MSEPFTNTPSTEPAPLPEVREFFALFMTLATAGLVVLICAADLAIVLLRRPPVGLVGLFSVVVPLQAVLVAAFTILVNVYVVWRRPRGGHGGHGGYGGYGGYGGGYDLQFTQFTSRAGGIRGALQLLTGRRRSRRLPIVSMALLLASLPLAAVPHVPSTTPLIGALGAWQGQDQVDNPVVLVVPTDAPAVSTGTATALPTAPPTDTTNTNAIPTATARPTATVPVPRATATSTPGPAIAFTVMPPSASYSHCADSSAVPTQPLTLDNTKGTVAVSWQATVVESIPGGPWATISDTGGNSVSSGTVPAGKTQDIIVVPAPTLCQYSHNGKSWHTSITTANAGTFTFVYAVS